MSAKSEQILSNRQDIDSILGTISGAMRYNGTLLSVGASAGGQLSSFFSQALSVEDFGFEMKTGFTYRISSDETGLSDADGNEIMFRPGDVLMFNADTDISSARISDFDMIRDYGNDIDGLLDAAKQYVDEVSASLSSSLTSMISGVSSVIDGKVNGINSFIDRTFNDAGADIPGKVKLFDEVDNKIYVMHMISGTIKLVAETV